MKNPGCLGCYCFPSLHMHTQGSMFSVAHLVFRVLDDIA